MWTGGFQVTAIPALIPLSRYIWRIQRIDLDRPMRKEYARLSPVPVIELLDIVPNETYIFLLGSKAEKNGDVQRRKSCSDKDSSVLRRRDSSGRYSPVICKALTKGFRLFIFFSYEIVGGWLAEGGDNLEPTGASPPIDNLR
ncbi:hypothetical protein BHE74_00001748 [Ensete ventricosum]|nr:hypothetical protein GW17_00004847 [Ensete ventricosum]RWW89312.1 hypothetical protein BHE74_00001748 [Ensete ventricosum]